MRATSLALVWILWGCGGDTGSSTPAATTAPAAPPQAAAPTAEAPPSADTPPTPPDPAPATAAAPTTPPPPDAADGDATGPELGDRPARPPADDELPTFSGGTVELTVVLPSTMSGQVDFITPDSGGEMPYTLLHAERFDSVDRVEVDAPSQLDGPLYVVVHQFPAGRPSYEPGGSQGVVVDPVDLAKGDQELTVVMNEGTEWMAELFQPGEGEEVPAPDPDKDKDKDKPPG